MYLLVIVIKQLHIPSLGTNIIADRRRIERVVKITVDHRIRKNVKVSFHISDHSTATIIGLLDHNLLVIKDNQHYSFLFTNKIH